MVLTFRYVDNDTGLAVTKTLGLLDTKGYTTALELKDFIVKIIARFDIQPTQIVAVVTDNAANMIRMTQDLNEEVQSSSNIDYGENENEDEGNENEEANRLEQLVTNAIRSLPDVTVIRCAAHILQLVINDGLITENRRLLAKIRKVVKAARRPLVKSFLDSHGHKQPVIDIVTRWGSTFLMIKSLNSIKDVIEELSRTEADLSMTRYEWKCCKEMEDILKGPYDVTVAFQADNLTAGYFVYMWSRLKHGLNNAADGIGATMSGLMVDREPSLFNDLTLAAVGLDPKNSFVLELQPLFDEIENKIINQLTKLVMQIKSIQDGNVEMMAVDNESIDDNAAQLDEVIEQDEDEFDMLIRQRQQAAENLHDQVR